MPQPETAPVPEPQVDKAKDDATLALSNANKEITSAQRQNKDIAVARQRLDAANTAFTKKDYAKAAALAQEAVQLAKNAKVPEVKAQAPVVAPEKPKGGLDMGLLIVVGLVVIIGAGAYLWMNQSKGKK